ncbi:MAG: DUF7678 domain-containing protein [Anaerovoracaceae bacterium]|jgi:hypothetical protein
MWREGTIGIPVKGQEKLVIVHYWVKHYEEGSEFGINEGRISKLMVKQGEKVILNYDRGWDVKEETEVANLALCILLNDYN